MQLLYEIGLFFFEFLSFWVLEFLSFIYELIKEKENDRKETVTTLQLFVNC